LLERSYKIGIESLNKFSSSSIAVLSIIFIGLCAPLAFSFLPSLNLLAGIFVSLILTSIINVIFCCKRLRVISRFLVNAALLVLAIIYSVWHHSNHYKLELPREYESQSIQLRGQVVGLPSNNSQRVRFVFKVETALGNTSGEIEPLSFLRQQRVQLSCYRCSLSVLPGQKWQFTVRLKNPHGFASWGAFDFEKYLFRHQIVARGYIRLKEVNSFLGEGHWSVDQFRQQIRGNLQHQLADYPAALGIIAALMIGDKSLLSRGQKVAFRITGLSHLMAISGLHIGLVFAVTLLIFKWFLTLSPQIFEWRPRQHLILLPALLAALAYSAMAGFAVSTQRAFIMLLVYVLCRLWAREISLLRVLLYAATLILIVDPFSILDAGYWLSCGAVMIIALFAQRQKSMSLLRLQPMLWLLMFGQISLISPLINLLAVPLFCVLLIPLVLITLVIGLLGMATMQSLILDYLGPVFDWISTLIVKISGLPHVLYFPTDLPFSFIVILLVSMLAWVCAYRYRLLFLPLCIFGFAVSGPKPVTENEVLITLLDVGQGLAMVVEAKDYVLVYDSGPAYQSGLNTADAVLLPYLRYRGISKIHDVIISHADSDHIGGLSALQRQIPIDRILSSRPDKIPFAQECRAGQSWHNQRKSGNHPAGKIRFSIISPDDQTPNGSNNRSCVLRVENDRFSMLISGDIERPVERYLLQNNARLAADFLLVPHQGSKTSSSAAFIQAVAPEIAVVAAGYRSHYGHPHSNVVKRYQQRNIEFLSTVVYGSILLKFNASSWSKTSYRLTSGGFWNRQKTPNWQR